MVLRSVEGYPYTNSQSPISCYSCATKDVKAPIITDPNSGEVICSSCGRILIEREEQGSKEWRDFDLDDYGLRTRVGAPVTLARHDLGLSTIIGSSNKDASGKKLEPTMRSMMNRIMSKIIRIRIRHTCQKFL